MNINANVYPDLKQQVTRGVAALTIKRVLMQFIVTMSNIILARLLLPQIFGLYAILSFVVVMSLLISEFGFAQAITQKPERVTTRELQAILTVLLLGGGLLALVIFLAAPLIDHVYQNQLGVSGVFWLRLYSLNIIFSHLSLVPVSLLTRELNFVKSAVGEVAVMFISKVLTVIFAIKGMGVGSFVLGEVIASIVGIGVYFALSPWPLGINLRFKDLAQFVSFCFNYQISKLTEVVNGSVIPVFVGAVSGTTAVGFINWAGGIRQVGLSPFEIIYKLILPSVAKTKDNTRILKKLTERLFEFVSLTSFPLLALIFVFAREITVLIYTDKWLPGLTALYLSLIQGVFILFGLVCTEILWALGETKFVRNITLFWAVFQWLLTVPMVLAWNFNGAVLAGIIVSATFFIPFMRVKKYVEFHFWKIVLPYLGIAILSGVIVFFLKQNFEIYSVVTLISMGFFGIGIYALLLLIFLRRRVLSLW